jgi:hypothetical protein
MDFITDWLPLPAPKKIVEDHGLILPIRWNWRYFLACIFVLGDRGELGFCHTDVAGVTH